MDDVKINLEWKYQSTKKLLKITKCEHFHEKGIDR